jgi:large subunit ribosomal protein L14e
MEIRKSDIVQSVAGRDKGKLFFVIDRDEEFLILADGKGRKLENPKRKKLKHVRLCGQSDTRTAQKLRDGDKVLNSELRKALAEYSAGFNQA